MRPRGASSASKDTSRGRTQWGVRIRETYDSSLPAKKTMMTKKKYDAEKATRDLRPDRRRAPGAETATLI